MKKLIACLLAALLVLLPGCGAKAPLPVKPAAEPLNLIFATDIHYLAPELYAGSDYFLELVHSSDGKMTHYVQEITEAFIEAVLMAKPDALVLGGDVSYHGEKASHAALAKLLQPVADAGIPVLVAPGNHDINRWNARAFTDDGYETTDMVTPGEFWKLYAPLGAQGSTSRDESSLSYACRLREDVVLLMLDTCIYENFIMESGRIKGGTLEWLEKELAAARDNGDTVITVTHHNLLVHNQLLGAGYTIGNQHAALPLWEEYGVALNLSGHIHMQHIEQNENGVTDVANGSLSVYPNYYGSVTVAPGGAVEYEALRVNVSAYAASTGSENPDLLDFEAYSLGFFNRGTLARQLEGLSRLGISDADLADMLQMADDLNAAYFAGLPSGIALEDEAYQLWLEQAPAEFFTHYLQYILETEKDSTRVTVP